VNVWFEVIVGGRETTTAPVVGLVLICPAVPVTLVTEVPDPEHEPHTAMPPTPITH
jgi:ABC-type branched-subunit amino acid transport system permease subunit